MRDWVEIVRQRLELPAMKNHRDERMVGELAAHLEEVYKEAMANGATDEAAEALALASLGDTARATSELERAEPHRARARVGRWAEKREDHLRRKAGPWTLLADGLRDLRLALRTLAKKPVLNGVIILVLAVGVGATTAVFTLLDAIILSPLPYNESERLVSVSHTAPGLGIQDAGQCAAWHFTYEDEARVFQDLGLFFDGTATVVGQGAPEAVPAMRATAGLFRALRLQPVIGRLFLPEDESLEAPEVVLLGHGYWQSRFGGDPDVLGQVIRADAQTWEIVGVAPPGVNSLGPAPDLIFPIRVDRSMLYVGNIGLGGLARLKDGVTLEQANADVARLLPLAVEKFPGGPVANLSEKAELAPNLRPLKETLVGDVSSLLWIVMAGVGGVLLIACANVANLLLVKASGKRSEMAVRAALGAGRRRIVWEYMKEGLVLALLGGVAGLAVGQIGLDALIAISPANLPRLDEVALNRDVLLFAMAVSVGAGLLFGILPALRHRQDGLVEPLKQGGRGGARSRARQRVQSALAVSQIALSVLLLVGSGLMLRSFMSLRQVDPGFHHADSVLAFRLFLDANEVESSEDVATTYEAIAHRLEQIPGVTSVAMGTAIPMDGGNNVNPLYVEGRELQDDRPPQMYRHRWVGGGFLETLHIPLLMGRTLEWQDVHDRAPAVLVSEGLAREIWGSPAAALDQGLSVRPDPPRWSKVVGVVADVRDDGLGATPPLMVYWPHVTTDFWADSEEGELLVWRGAGFAVRSLRVGTDGFLGEVRAAVWDVNPNLPIRNARPLGELMAGSIARTSFTLVLLCIAASVALFIGLIGVYGVISYGVNQRAGEFGMRMALGAQCVDVTRMVLREGLSLSLAGLGVGLVLALLATRLMDSLLFDVSPLDPVTFVLVPAALLTVVLVASYVPARRAAQVDPMSVLRAE